MFKRRKTEEMHLVALARLRRDRQSIADYFQVRADQRLDETFDAWDAAELPDDAGPGAPRTHEPPASFGDGGSGA